MANNMRDRLLAMAEGGVPAEEARLYSAFDKMFIEWNESKGARRGIHASSILNDKDFCYREQILTLFHTPKVSKLPASLLRIFLEGWKIHEKWQALFEQAGYAIEVEKTRYHEAYDLHFTPDAIIEFRKTQYVVEIKSMNTFQFKNLKKVPPAAVRQANLYMRFTGVHRAIILVDDKNSQEFKVFVVEYDPEMAKPYTTRLSWIAKMRIIYRDSGRLPHRLKTCGSPMDKRAERCPFVEVCFMSREARMKEMVEFIGTNASCDTKQKVAA